MRPTLRSLTQLAVLTLFGAAAGPAPVSAQGLQPGRIAFEAVAATTTSSQAADDPFVFLDLTTTVRVNDQLDVIIRPWARRLPGGDWDALFYQAQIRYQPALWMRLDAGIISSPLGLGTLELRQDLNPVVGSPFYYFSRLPVFDAQSDRVQILAGGYPIGAVLSASGSWWDVRTGITDGTPARYRKIFARNNPAAAAQFIAGGGITPAPGLRFGAGFAHGPYRQASDSDYYGLPATAVLADGNATVFNLEGEYAFRYTRLTAEWVRDEFDSPNSPAVSRGLYLQGVQTITPRIFAASRFTHASMPALVRGSRVRWTRSALEISAGYRLTPQFTLKGGYEAAKPQGVTAWTHSAVGSVVWAKRWF